MTSHADLDSIRCYNYSKVEKGLVCAGQSNGVVNVFNLKKPDIATLELKPKQSRTCNSVAFNSHGLVAAGFDKVRNDNCLVIWNVEHYASASSPADNNNGNSNSSTNNITTPLEGHLPNEVVSSVSFLPHNPNILLCGSYKFIREFDLRSPTPNFQYAAKCSQGITVNPIDDNFFASYSDTSVALWDRRQMRSGSSSTVEPVLYMPRLFGDNSRKGGLSNSCFRFSLKNTSEFAVLNDGDLIRRWQLGSVPPMPERLAKINSTSRPHSQDNGGGEGRTHSYITKNGTLFVSGVLDNKTVYDKVSSFDYTQDISNPNSINFMCIRQSGQLFRMNVIESPDATSFDPYNNLAIVDPERVSVATASSPGLTSHRPSVQMSEASTAGNRHRARSKDRRASEISEKSIGDDDDDDYDDDNDGGEEDEATDNKQRKDSNVSFGASASSTREGILDFKSVLNGDISSVMRRRAEKGYSLDCLANINILKEESDDNYIRYAWQWLLHAKKAESKGDMAKGDLDLGFEGVLGIWGGSSDLTGQSRSVANNNNAVTDRTFNDTTSAIVKASKNVFISPSVSRSEKENRRRLSLLVAGWNFGLDGLNARIEQLEEKGQYEKAAGWAVFHGDVERAVAALASSNKQRLKLMSTAVAGYLAYRNDEVNSPWREQCRRLASDLSNPYLRAIFAFISDGSWLDVLDEGSLPLVERLGIALRFLPDDELSSYLNRVTDRVVNSGDLEGIILTGITPRVVKLLQCYIDKTGDVQTPSLISSFGCPRYFEDPRISNWVEEYRMLLNRWRMFSQRAKFDVGRTSLSKTHLGKTTIKPPPKQIYVRCNHCKKTIGGGMSRINDPIGMTKSNKGRQLASKETMGKCQYCNNPLSRCAVCLLPLGSPLPTLKPTGGNATESLNKRFEQWATFCLSCSHGLHAGHAKEWFSKHDVCPVPTCGCMCNASK